MPDEIAETIGKLIEQSFQVQDHKEEIIVQDYEEFEKIENSRLEQLQKERQENERKRKRLEYEESLVPIEDQKLVFMQLLNDLNISPYSFFDNIRSKLEADDRYFKVFQHKNRVEFFEEYCKMKQDTFSPTLNIKEETYQSLLNDQVKKPTEWALFSKRFARDKRFTALERAKRELMFKEHVKKLKSGENVPDKLQRQEQSLRSRELQVKSQLKHSEKQAAKRKEELEHSEAIIVFQDLLRLYANVSKSFDEMMSGEIQTNTSISMLLNSEKKQMHSEYVEKLFEPIAKKLLMQHCPPVSDFKWEKIQNVPEAFKVPPHLIEKDGSIEKVWHSYHMNLQSQTRKSLLDELIDSIKENQFIKFNVKQLVNDLCAKMIEEEKKMPTNQQVWEYIDIEEYCRVLESDSRWTESSIPNKKQLLLDQVNQYIEETFAEKGGTVDKLIATAATTTKR